MGKLTVAPSRPTTVPLHDVTIRWKQPDYFSTEWPEREISGADLARVLTYLGRLAGNPGFLFDVRDLGQHAERVAAISGLCRAMKREDDGCALDTDRILWALEWILEDQAARLAALAGTTIDATATLQPAAESADGPSLAGRHLHAVTPLAGRTRRGRRKAGKIEITVEQGDA
jgi:hypothetical protein